MGENSTVNVSESPPRGAEARGSTEKRFTLRYSRVFRDCRRPLAAGTRAVHDSTTRSVRCIACPEPGTAATLEKTPPTADSTSAPGGIPRLSPAPLTHRAPASGVIAEALRLQANASSRSRLDRLFGRSPLAPDAESWFLGAIGEIEVARILAALGSEWRVFHSVPVGSNGSDIDHLVIGPAGVFTINTKHRAGRSVWVGDRRLMVDGQRTDYLRNSGHEAERAARLLSSATGSAIDVVPLLVIVGAKRITERSKPARVVVLSAERTTRWLRARPETLSVDSIHAVATAAAEFSTWNAPTPPEPDLDAFARLRTDVARARVRRQLWASAAAAGMVGLLVSAPSWFGELLAGILAR